MSRVRVCFLGTPDFAAHSLEALIADEHYEIVGVITQPDRPSGRNLQLLPCAVKKLALERGLRVLSPQSIKLKDSLWFEIQSWQAEVAVVVAFGQILTEEFMSQFPLGCVNLHASLLPRWRGAAPIQRAIEAGDLETGICLQKMVKKLDAGDILGSRKIDISEEMNSMDLQIKLADLGVELLHVELMDYIRGHLSPKAQDETQVTYAHKINKAESLIDWNLPSKDIHNKVRAFVWGPGTYSYFEGQRIKIYSSVLPKNQLNKSIVRAVGELFLDGEDVAIQCGDGFLFLKELQPESRKRLRAIEFYRNVSISGKNKKIQFQSELS